MRWGTSENFEKKWDMNLHKREMKCRDLLLEEHCENVFCLMDSFWEAIAGANVDWLIKVRSHPNKTDKEQEKVKRKKLYSLSRNSSLKKMVFG